METDSRHDEHAQNQRSRVAAIKLTPRISALKDQLQAEPRFMSVEQASIITESYREHPDEPRVLQRAHALERALRQIRIRIDPGELIVGNRTSEIRAGVNPSAQSGCLGMTISLLGLILWLFERLETRRPDTRPAAVLPLFGWEPLLFYLLHLFAYAILCFVLVLVARPVLTLAGWLISLASFAPILCWFQKIKAVGRLPVFLRWL
ncbi:MAG: hypothetical protein KAU31_06790 [Spirochaetaceae bacterium]|nr:hypothetical protein [Spirochaetaceae bacterium]